MSYNLLNRYDGNKWKKGDSLKILDRETLNMRGSCDIFLLDEGIISMRCLCDALLLDEIYKIDIVVAKLCCHANVIYHRLYAYARCNTSSFIVNKDAPTGSRILFVFVFSYDSSVTSFSGLSMFDCPFDFI
jgi:hypothetical protein